MRSILKYVIGACVLLLFSNTANAQCSVSGDANPDTLTCGDTLFLSAFGLGGAPLIDVNFNNGSAGTGWATTAGVDFTNPCSPGPDGTYLWMGDGTPAPRSLTTVPLDLSCGATVCFDLRMSIQGGASPCEGPDQPNEGIFLQFSHNNGTNWTNVYYFNPDTNGTGGSAASPFTTWGNYCFQLPPLTTNSLIRWAQTSTSGNGYDHWGLDNVQIYSNCGDPYNYAWAGIGTVQDTFVAPIAQTDSSFVVSYFNSADTCYDTVDVHILPRPISVSGDVQLCDTVGGIDAQLFANGGNDYFWGIVPGGDPINGSNFGCATCANTWAHPNTTTSYVVSTDLTGICHGTDTVTVEIVSAFDPSFSFNSPICANDVNQTFIPVNSGGVWTGTGVVDGATGIFDPTIAGAGIIPVTYTIPGACANTTTVDIEVIGLPDATITAPDQYCFDGGALSLIAATPGGVFSGSGGVDGVNETFDPTGLTPGVYNVYYTLTTPCTSIDTHKIEVLNSVPYSVVTPIVICDNESLVLSDSLTVGANYTEPVVMNFTGGGITNVSSGIFNGGLVTPGNHTIQVTLTDTFGLCASDKTINISVNLTEYNNLLKDVYCSNEGNVFLQTDKPLTATIWSNTAINTGQDSIQLNNFNSFNTEDYGEGKWAFNFSYTNVNGCTGVTYDTLIILKTPDNPIVSSENFCENEEVILEATHDNPDSVYFEQRDGATVNSLGFGTPNANFGLAPDPASGVIKVYAKEVNGICESEFVEYIVPIKPAPVASFLVDYKDLQGVQHYDSLVTEGDTIRGNLPLTMWLRAQGFGATDSLSWDLNFNDWSGHGDIIRNTEGDVPVLPQDFRSPGLHELMLVHVNEFGCEDNYSIYLEVIGTEELPNVITPNGDGINDVFYVIAPVRDFTVQIFNRWGAEVYSYNCNQCSQNEKGWNGGDHGDGTYFYTVTGKYNDGSDYLQKGNLTITGSN